MMWRLTTTPKKMDRTITKVNHMRAAILTATMVMDTAMDTLLTKVTSQVQNVTLRILFTAPRGQKRSTCTTPCST